MVAVIAEPLHELEERFVTEQLAEVLPFPSPRGPRHRCWLVRGEEVTRGLAKDITPRGARVTGVHARFALGERLVCELELGDEEPPVVLRCKIEHVGTGEVVLRFLELGFAEWYRLKRFVAGGDAPPSPSSVLMPPA
jgi:hypothetical protein